MAYTKIVQGESYYETLVMCNYAVAGNLQGEKYIWQSSPDLVQEERCTLWESLARIAPRGTPARKQFQHQHNDVYGDDDNDDYDDYDN